MTPPLLSVFPDDSITVVLVVGRYIGRGRKEREKGREGEKGNESEGEGGQRTEGIRERERVLTSTYFSFTEGRLVLSKQRHCYHGHQAPPPLQGQL